jgi:hypothetical protein
LVRFLIGLEGLDDRRIDADELDFDQVAGLGARDPDRRLIRGGNELGDPIEPRFDFFVHGDRNRKIDVLGDHEGRRCVRFQKVRDFGSRHEDAGDLENRLDGAQRRKQPVPERHLESIAVR